MRKSRILKLCVLALLLLFYIEKGFSCSMYKVTVNGKTMVGNNEDSWRLTSKIWFEQGTNDKLGVAYVGYSDKPNPDGAMNESGLAFDAFTMPRKANLNNRPTGKDDFSYAQLKTIMQHCKTVDEVYSFLGKLDLHILNGNLIFNGGMFLFIDKTGKYLVVEADTLILGNDDKFVLSNFSFADTKDLSTVKIKRYCKGVEFLKNKTGTSIEFCTALSDTMSVSRTKAGDGTLYTTIYDLNDGLIYAYFFHDYSKGITFDIHKELAKGDHEYRFPDLFPDNKGYQKFVSYKTPQNSRVLFGTIVLFGVLFFFSSIYFTVSFIKTAGRKSPFRNTRLGLSLLCLALGYYSFILIKNQAIFYFPSPYMDDHFSIVNLTSYLPFILLILILPLLATNIKIARLNSWNTFSKWLFVINNISFIILTGLFAYWGLFNVFS